MSTTTQALIEVQQHPVLGPSVSGRAVYSIVAESRSVRNIFSDWFREKQRRLDLIEGKDFVQTTVVLSGTNRKHIEHILTIDAARQIAEVAPAKRGLELDAYLKYYGRIEGEPTTQPQVSTEASTLKVEPVSLVSLFNPTSESTLVNVEPTPAPIAPTPLSPAQQLLAEVQKLVDAEQSRKDESEVLPDQLKLMAGRIGRLEGQVNVILYFFQQASTALRSLPPAQLPYDAGLGAQALPDLEPTKRAKINRLVDGYAAAKTVSNQEVWKHLYGHLSTRFGFDAWQHAQSKKTPNYLEIVEENGQLENLYSIAVELLTLSQR